MSRIHIFYSNVSNDNENNVKQCDKVKVVALSDGTTENYDLNLQLTSAL